MYRGLKGLGAIADEKRARQFALLICLFALDSLKKYVVFFGVEFDQGFFLGLLKKCHRYCSWWAALSDIIAFKP